MSFTLDGWPEPNYRDPEQAERAENRAWERLKRQAARAQTALDRARRRDERAAQEEATS